MALIGRDLEAARARFGAVWTRTGWPFFPRS
jgi:hypothetical protein